MDKKLEHNNLERVKNASYSITTTLLVLLFIIIANIVFQVVGSDFTEVSLEGDTGIVFNDITNNLLESLDEDVTLYVIAEEGNENAQVKEYISIYKEACTHIKVEQINPVSDPLFLNEHNITDVSQGSVLVVASEREKMVDVSEFFTDISNDDETTYKIDVEGVLTSAIAYTTSDEIANVYILNGDSVSGLDQFTGNEIARQNMVLTNLTLSNTSSIPEDCDAIIISRITEDFEDEVYEQLSDFVDNGGSLMIITTVEGRRSNLTSMPNYDKLIAKFGLVDEYGVVVESDKINMINGDTPVYIYPQISEHSITNGLTEKGKVLLYYADSIAETIDKAENIVVEPLLKSSNDSFLKNLNSGQTLEKLISDPVGPFNLAVASTIDKGTDKESKLVLVSSYVIVDESEDEKSAGTNSQFVVNSMMWLTDQTVDVSIPVKDSSDFPLLMTANDTQTFMNIFVILLPSVIVLFGIIVWVRRRKR